MITLGCAIVATTSCSSKLACTGTLRASPTCPDMSIVDDAECKLFYVEHVSSAHTTTEYRQCELDEFEIECVPSERTCIHAQSACDSMYEEALKSERIAHCGKCRLVRSQKNGAVHALGCESDADCVDECGCKRLYGLMRGKCAPMHKRICTSLMCVTLDVTRTCHCYE